MELAEEFKAPVHRRGTQRAPARHHDGFAVPEFEPMHDARATGLVVVCRPWLRSWLPAWSAGTAHTAKKDHQQMLT